MKPYPAIFKSMAAKITDPAVGASTWASGNQVWKGHIGNITANELKNANKSKFWYSWGILKSNNSITSVPESIGLLDSLITLKLDSNNISELPNTITNLLQLDHLNLDHNQLLSIPYFIIGFILVAFLQSFNYLPLYFVDTFKIVSKIFLLFAMCSIGLKVSFISLANQGGKIFLATFFAFMLQVIIVIQIVT